MELEFKRLNVLSRLPLEILYREMGTGTIFGVLEEHQNDKIKNTRKALWCLVENYPRARRSALLPFDHQGLRHFFTFAQRRLIRAYGTGVYPKEGSEKFSTKRNKYVLYLHSSMQRQLSICWLYKQSRKESCGT